MSTKKGQLSIHSENIFPIIKKWLYSDHDIFVRELVSNASDAITKLKKLSAIGETTLASDETFSIHVELDPENKTMTFTDNGIGMTGEEVEKYINQIAFSGAEDFLHAYKDKADKEQIIGHFGLGFYSAFMVAHQVEIFTKSYKTDSQAVHWVCDGGTEFSLEDCDKEERGTRIVLHLSDDGKEFLEKYTLKQVLDKYCSFMPYPIYFKDLSEKTATDDADSTENEPKVETPINDTEPLYTKQPATCTDEDYKAFYRKTFMDFKEPLFWIHLNMDYPFNLKGILYFPKLGTEFETAEGRIKLYNNQVFVAENIKEVIPEFLLLLKGVVDCPDLPLNVSRSFLQNDGFVRKISDYITRKVADKLTGLFNTQRETFEGFWNDIHPFIKYGILKDEKFYDKVKDAVLYKTTDNRFLTLQEYKEAYCLDEEKTIYYATDLIQQAQYVELLKAHDKVAMVLEERIDQPFITHIEQKEEKVHFKRVDTGIKGDSEEASSASEEETTRIGDWFKKVLGKENLSLKLEAVKATDISAMLVLDEEKRRFSEMMKLYGMNQPGMNLGGSDSVLVLNTENILVKKLLSLGDQESDLAKLIIAQIYDLAKLSHEPLTAEEMLAFTKRSNQLMSQLL